MDVENPRVSRRKFYVHLSGRTNGAHLPWVSKCQGFGQVKVNSPEDSDYILLFCPITSRVGTDIGEALENISAEDKEVVLVVMHHTFNKDYVVSESRRQVSDPKVLLVVDTLFFEGRPLESKRNDIAWDEIKTFLGVRVRIHAEVVSCDPSDECTKYIVTAVFAFVVTLVAGIFLGRLSLGMSLCYWSEEQKTILIIVPLVSFGIWLVIMCYLYKKKLSLTKSTVI